MLRDSFRSRAISLIDFPWTKCSRRIRPIVSTISIPHRPLRAKAGSRTNRKSGGQFWTPITPPQGVNFARRNTLLRITTGLLLVPHGAQKLFGWFGGYGVDATDQFFATKLGLPASLALLAGLIEFFGGLALATGLATRFVAALVFGVMAVAVVFVHLRSGSSG